MAERVSEYVQRETTAWKRVSWPAVFSGTFVALATELLFTAFGLFIALKFNSRGAISDWSEGWYFLTAFFALFIGGWVGGRLSTNTSGSGRIHGAVIWGLTTIATFAFVVWLFAGPVSGVVSAARTSAVAANTVAVTRSSATQAPANVKQQAAETMAQASAQEPSMFGRFAAGASTLFLVIFGGILSGCVGALAGGTLGGGGYRGIPPGTQSSEIAGGLRGTATAKAAGA